MATDINYIDELMKSIEPVVYPDGDPDNLDEYSDLDEVDFDNTQTPSSSDAIELSEDMFEDIEEEPEMVEIGEIDIPEKGEEVAPVKIEEESPEQALETALETEYVEKEPIGDDLEELTLTEDEINAMLDFAKESGEAAATSVNEDADVKDLLGMFDNDAEMQDIKNTLDKADNNVAVDASALQEKEIVIPDIDEEETIEEKPAKGKKEKKSKKKKEKPVAEEGTEGEVKEKKKGLFGKLFEKLTEEVPEEEEVVSGDNLVSDENAKILSELDAEEDPKGKKKKKKKEKKGKKEKEVSETEGEEKDIREKGSDEEASKGKKKKEKKPKKEKAQEEDQRPVKKLPKKRVRNTFILCLSILAGIILLVFLMNDFLNRKEAREAFNEKDYETAYADLYGMDLKDKDAEIYNKSATIMILQRKVDSYENYLRLGMKEEALNALLTGYRIYPNVYKNAEKYGVTSEVDAVYAEILNGLASFNVDTQDADAINAMESIVEYNKAVVAIANGGSFSLDTSEEAVEEVIEEPVIQDVLPEELDYLPDNPEDLF